MAVGPEAKILKILGHGQTVAPPRAPAGVAAGFEFAAGRGPPFVDAARRAFAHAARQRGAARRLVVGAAHAAGVRCDRDRQPVRHLAACGQQFFGREVDPKTGAAGAAAQAVGHRVGVASGGAVPSQVAGTTGPVGEGVFIVNTGNPEYLM